MNEITIPHVKHAVALLKARLYDSAQLLPEALTARLPNVLNELFNDLCDMNGMNNGVIHAV